MKTVAVLVGSLSPNSINRQLTRTLEKLAGGKLKFSYADLGSLPHYDNELWSNPPAAVTQFKQLVESADAVLIAMPEFNRSFPALIKNALDWGSRPWGQSSWHGKPTALIGASVGAVGTAAGQGHLRSILPVYGLILMGQPEMYFTMKPGLITDDLEVTDEATATFLSGWTDKFAAFIERYGDVALDVAAE
ncbi:NAD(P)H-dependent oxidoreductase [Devosia neptuniae]|uniref:NAD(P)H-dependent oxidoreductase n=1 Tax=Devosia neptuniae TaxID=191302 RepID=A0ABY6CD21_9HYPH|nr:NAD(P)H-dependent oxidoreductase [Devosia neptuniae]UXN68861.1 NAD(P)H-dependent oxidoreductase [Devosia neptuniae]